MDSITSLRVCKVQKDLAPGITTFRPRDSLHSPRAPLNAADASANHKIAVPPQRCSSNSDSSFSVLLAESGLEVLEPPKSVQRQ